MRKDEKEIEKIYVVRDQAPDGSKYTSQILIQYMDQKVKYFNLSPSELKGSIKKQEKAKQNMEKYLKKIVKDLRKEDYQKLVFVPDHDQKLKEYVDRKIRIQEAKSLKGAETACQLLSTIQTIASLSMMLSPLYGPTSVVISSFAASAYSTIAMMDNHERKKLLSQEKANWIQKFRFGFSMALLGINATFAINNLSLHLDNIEKDQAKYQLQSDKIGNRDLYIEGLDNPFENDITFTSADAATNVLLGAFGLNPLIEDEDRRVASSLRQYLMENPYLDYEALYDDFASFAIIDSNEKNGNISASNFDDYIMVYDRENQDSVMYSETLKHELVHRTGHLSIPMLNEGMTSLLTYEYLCDLKYTDAYYDETIMARIFCELITPEKMLEAYSQDDMNIIKNELLKLNPSEEYYGQLMDLMNNYTLERRKYVEKGTLSSFYDEGHALSYRDSFAMAVMQYMYNANFSEEKVDRITLYLKAMGTGNHFVAPYGFYFNKKLKELSYENAYSSELTENSDYHY